MGGSPGRFQGLSEILWHTGIYTLTDGDLDGWQTRDSPGTVRVTVAYQDTLTEGDLDGWQSRDSLGTVRVTLAYRDILTEGDLDGWQSQDSPRTVRVTLAYRDTLTEGDLDGWQSWEGPGTVKSFFGIPGYSDRGGGSPGIVLGLSEFLWHTGIL